MFVSFSPILTGKKPDFGQKLFAKSFDTAFYLSRKPFWKKRIWKRNWDTFCPDSERKLLSTKSSSLLSTYREKFYGRTFWKLFIHLQQFLRFWKNFFFQGSWENCILFVQRNVLNMVLFSRRNFFGLWKETFHVLSEMFSGSVLITVSNVCWRALWLSFPLERCKFFEIEQI